MQRCRACGSRTSRRTGCASASAGCRAHQPRNARRPSRTAAGGSARASAASPRARRRAPRRGTRAAATRRARSRRRSETASPPWPQVQSPCRSPPAGAADARATGSGRARRRLGGKLDRRRSSASAACPFGAAGAGPAGEVQAAARPAAVSIVRRPRRGPSGSRSGRRTWRSRSSRYISSISVGLHPDARGIEASALATQRALRACSGASRPGASARRARRPRRRRPACSPGTGPGSAARRSPGRRRPGRPRRPAPRPAPSTGESGGTYQTIGSVRYSGCSGSAIRQSHRERPRRASGAAASSQSLGMPSRRACARTSGSSGSRKTSSWASSRSLLVGRPRRPPRRGRRRRARSPR